VALLALLFPGCLAGPYGNISAYLRDAWLLRIDQERSLFMRPDFVFSGSMITAGIQFIGATALAVIALRDRLRDRNLLIFALFALLAMAQAILYSRNLRYLPLFAAPGLLFVLASLAPALRTKGALLGGRFVDMLRSPLALIAPGAAVSVAVVALCTALGERPAVEPAAGFAGSCDLGAVGNYAWPEHASVMAPPVVGIALLPGMSGASVVAVPFHTGAAGVERAYRFLDPATADPRTALDESRATHVAICAWRAEPSAELEARYPFAATLLEGKPPVWLTECPTDASAPIRIYRYPSGGIAGQTCPRLR
jgi:hypothetical protein